MVWQTVLLCITVFCCRILDVSLGTLRMITTVKGQKYIAMLFGFFEVLVWFVIVQRALSDEDSSFFVAISYAGGYSMGTLIGSVIAQRFVKTTVLVQVITSMRDEELLLKLRESGYPVTVMDVHGSDNKSAKFMLFIEIDSRKVDKLNKIILEHDAKAFITISEVKTTVNGYFSVKTK